MTLQLGHAAPDCEQDSTAGRIHLYDDRGSNWGMLFSHPRDLTMVCKKVATPANQTNGRPVKIASSLADAEAKARFPGGWLARKPYLRVVEQPKLPHEAT